MIVASKYSVKEIDGCRVYEVDWATHSSRPDNPWPGLAEDEVPDNILQFTQPPIEYEVMPVDLEKVQHFVQLMDFPGTTTTVINTHTPGVVLPTHLMNHMAVRLSWSYKFALSDFEIDDKGIKGSLSFGGQNFFTTVPWKAVWQIFKTEAPNDSMAMWPLIKVQDNQDDNLGENLEE